MRLITEAINGHSGADLPDLELAEAPDPVPGSGEVVIDIAAAGVNPADILQRRGLYAPPPGVSPILGLEVSGTIRSIGTSPDGAPWELGQSVAALLDGGGYAEQVAVPAAQVLPLPQGFDLIDAAALPEALCTAWSNLVDVGGLKANERVLIHGGSGGVGSIAVQLALALGAHVFTTAGGPQRAALIRDLVPTDTVERLTVIDYKAEDFAERVGELTDGAGVDVILDVVGAAYLKDNVKCLATNGRLVVIGMQKGRRGEVDLGALLSKRASVHGTTLRSRPAAEKAELVAAVRNHAWPLVASGQIRPIVHARLPLADAARAHTLVTDREVFGKMLLLP